jgi:hypothetical protein
MARLRETSVFLDGGLPAVTGMAVAAEHPARS